MCGISGIFNMNFQELDAPEKKIKTMIKLLSHRGPDFHNHWIHPNKFVGFGHNRLSIIDLSDNANQPMEGIDNNLITYNGEIYNYKEIRSSLNNDWNFKTNSDTECILSAYSKYGVKCLDNLRGMFSFSIWNPNKNELFCARDRFGIKPFYYFIKDNVFYFASEAKALLPFVDSIQTNKKAFAEYLTYQYTIGETTLFKGIKKLLPGHAILIKNNSIKIWKYWDVKYNVDFNLNSEFCYEKLSNLMQKSIKYHLIGDVEIGSYVSGGIDSSLLLNLATKSNQKPLKGFHGFFSNYKDYDESHYAKKATELINGELFTLDISSNDFSNNIEKIIYYLDFPTAGPGSFPQYMVSKLASEHLKVVIGGQGGDEIFGGYARYVIGYLEQCLLAAIDGSYKNGNYIVTLESIIPNLGILKEYKPLIKSFWSQGLFDSMDERYFSLIDRSKTLSNEINWNELDKSKVFENFKNIFNNKNNVQKEAYFDKMTHFDFKSLLPALLHVEDRMSMAHGLESRVPFLDHEIVEFVATIPANIKFENGKMKNLLKKTFANSIPVDILNRRDKMGFPVPLKEWFNSSLQNFVIDNLNNLKMKNRPFINSKTINLDKLVDNQFSRKTWALLSLELWYQQFHDNEQKFKKMIN